MVTHSLSLSHTHTHTHTYTYTHTHAQTHTHTLTHMCTHAHTITLAHTHTQVALPPPQPISPLNKHTNKCANCMSIAHTMVHLYSNWYHSFHQGPTVLLSALRVTAAFCSEIPSTMKHKPPEKKQRRQLFPKTKYLTWFGQENRFYPWPVFCLNTRTHTHTHTHIHTHTHTHTQTH